MTTTFLDITISLDGYVAGPDAGLEHPLGIGGEQLHEWAYELASWNASHGRDTGAERTPDDDIIEASDARTGAVVMGRRMFSGGSGPWQDDPNAMGWWGDNPPFHVPVYVVTHHRRERLEMEGGTTFEFVDGVEAAVEQARAAAGGRDVKVAGGASVAQQALAAGLLDELHVHVAPVLLGGGVRLFDGTAKLAIAGVQESPHVTHVTYRVAA